MSLNAYREPTGRHPELGKLRGVPVADPTRHYDGIAPASVFKNAIQRDPSLCNNCFADRYDYIALEWRCGSQGWQDWHRRYPIPGRNSPDPNRELRHDGGPLCCSRCGHHTGKDRPLAYRQATAHAGRISDALHGRGIVHDRKTLLAVVMDRIAIEETTGVEDVAVFPTAVAEAVRACQ